MPIAIADGGIIFRSSFPGRDSAMTADIVAAGESLTTKMRRFSAFSRRVRKYFASFSDAGIMFRLCKSSLQRFERAERSLLRHAGDLRCICCHIFNVDFFGPRGDLQKLVPRDFRSDLM